MLGVSQPGNPPSSLRHSASFSCLQRGSLDGPRSRTSTLPQQANPQLSSQQAEPQHQVSPSSSTGGPSHRYEQDSNDYGFVCVRPRLRSTTAVLREEEQQRHQQYSATKSVYRDREREGSAALSDLESSSSFREPKKEEKVREGKKQNLLQGASTLLTASTSSWWKARQREEVGSGGSSERKKVREGKNQNLLQGASTLLTASTSSWWKARQREELGSRGSSERKWSSPSNERKSAGLSGGGGSVGSVGTSGTPQDSAEWRSLGYELRILLTNETPTQNNPSNNQASFSPSARASMIETADGASEGKAHYPPATSYSARVLRTSRSFFREGGAEFPAQVNKVRRMLYRDEGEAPTGPAEAAGEAAGPPRDATSGSGTKTRYGPPTSYSARTSRTGRALFTEAGPESSSRIGETRRRLYREDGDAAESEGPPDDASTREVRADQAPQDCTWVPAATRSSRAQSFYLLDDFLKPQPQKCAANQYLTSLYSRVVGETQRSEVKQAPGVSMGSQQRGNATPPRRHNSSSDSLEVATSPLPPPVPPPPPQVGHRERDRDGPREKESCPCRMCWTALQQRAYPEEVSSKHALDDKLLRKKGSRVIWPGGPGFFLPEDLKEPQPRMVDDWTSE
ncbi:splicing factor, arginine/serine-rich 19-like [Orussus abietinus]|uniref:splicing factor, arginine/serine-rich 19-like n=1 Tax=Orussus abietinus TaxID=222816 RepID=UPI000C715FB5|nr:splicing factor, arginine/serine-rich 19-like [Orussus abietinus]